MNQFGERQVTRRGVAANEGSKAVGGKGLFDGPQAVRPFGMAGRNHVALEIALADEQGAQAGNLAALSFLDGPPGPCQTAAVTIHRPTRDNIERFGAALRAGDVVAFATETVYGLGADVTSSDAVLKI